MLIAESNELKFYHVQPGQVFSRLRSNRNKAYALDGSEELFMRCETSPTDKENPKVVNLRSGKIEEAPPVYQIVRVYKNAVLNLNDF